MLFISFFTKKLEMVSSPFPILNNLYRLYYKGMVKKEISLCGITDEDRVLCIGGGPFPCTAMEIAKKTGAQIEVIDYDPLAVKKAKKLINKMNLDKQISIKCAKGQELEVRDFSIIHVAFQAQPQKDILDSLLSKVNNGTKILMRSNVKELRTIFSCSKNHLRCTLLKDQEIKAQQNNACLSKRVTCLVEKIGKANELEMQRVV
ncbi:nicotianamine synthase family protein [Serpentinicella sp. ANB-PHB4]|uniref:nicotianamine synthase family protein n=1 Tax=Serpentinicella sp. ANB-PHB4 TaxID=3074076 RepID=UPI00285676AB|nr:nicotianamine synthase family protein [Serpentinicella sp. ANB-PHB4]MDR5658622.1 nicotianamine synthase family protein [Serpentinicella sp. ANB-PHB4]